MRRDASFIVRIWWEGREQATAEPIWRGQVQHAATGEAISFHNLEQLGTFFHRWTGALTTEHDSPPGGSTEATR